MMTHEASEQLVMSKIRMGSTWEFYLQTTSGEFYWLVVEPPGNCVDMWRVGPRGGVQRVMQVSAHVLRSMGLLLAQHNGQVRPYTPEEHEARLDAEIGAIKEGLGE